MGSKRTLASLSLASLSVQSSPMLYMFRNSSGKLQRQLRKGEFSMFKHSPVFEGDFVQISKKGYTIDVHNSVPLVTLGIAFSSPDLLMPDIMLLARPPEDHAFSAGPDQDKKGRGRKSAKNLVLTRLLPLKFVKLEVFNCEKRQLRLKLATGRSFYLQLLPPADGKEDAFAQWEDLVYLLRPPIEAHRGMQAEPSSDRMDLPELMDLPVLHADDNSPEAMEVHGEEKMDDVSIQSLPADTEVSGATSPAHSAREGVQPPTPGTVYGIINAEAVVTSAPVGLDQGAAREAALTPMSSKSVVSRGTNTPEWPGLGPCISRSRSMVSRGTDTSEGPGVGPCISALSRQVNTDEEGRVHRASKPQTESPKKQKEEAATRSSHSGRKREDKSLHRSHGTTHGHRKEKGHAGRSGTHKGSR